MGLMQFCACLCPVPGSQAVLIPCSLIHQYMYALAHTLLCMHTVIQSRWPFPLHTAKPSAGRPCRRLPSPQECCSAGAKPFTPQLVT